MKKLISHRTMMMVALLAVVAASGYGGGARGDDSTDTTINTPLSGQMAEVNEGNLQRWTGWETNEDYRCLMTGEIILRFTGEGREEPELLNCGEFKQAVTGYESGKIRRGCPGGRRYPSPRKDDDGDGRINEEEPDGLDNDGDGMIDEDFEAIGNRMTVVRLENQRWGLRVLQKSYRWDYSHVDDFTGFTTILENRGNADRGSGKLLDMEIILRGGIRSDQETGNKDKGSCRWGWMTTGDDEDGGGRTLQVAVSRQGDDRDYMEGIVPLGVRFPKSGEGKIRGVMVGGGVDQVDSLWSRIEDEGLVPDVTEEWVEGEMSVVYHLGGIQEFYPGERIEVDWAVVSGNGIAELKRNIKYLVLTYRGVTDRDGRDIRWVLPARQAVLRKLEVTPASFWARGEKRTAAAVNLGEELREEKLEWLKLGEELISTYKKMGSKILVPVDQSLLDRGKPLDIEGQLGEGTIFAATITEEDITAMKSEEMISPGQLPSRHLQLFPNPFIENLNINLMVSGDISGGLKESSGPANYRHSSVKVYNIEGHLVYEVMEKDFLPPGDYMFSWNGIDEGGRKVAPGVYYCRLQIGDKSVTKRVILLR